SIELPVSEHGFPGGRFRKEMLVCSQWQFEVVVDVQAMRLIEAGETAFGAQVECILRERSAAPASGNAGRVVDGFRELVLPAKGNSSPQSSIHSNRSGMENRVRGGSFPV